MSNITFHETTASGIGTHREEIICKDGENVGLLYFSGFINGRWCIHDFHYRTPIARDEPTINDAREAAREYDWQTVEEVYEAVCQKVEAKRREQKERWMADRLAAVARDLLNGSNSAHDDIAKIIAKIEAYAKDRSDIGNYHAALGNGWGDPTAAYPNPPEVIAKEKV